MSAANETWIWTRRFGVGLTASCAAFAAFNFVAPFLPRTVPVGGAEVPLTGLLAAILLAAVVACSQGLANCMAANARRVSAVGHRTAGRICWVLCFGFAAVAWLGLHNAWQSVRGFAVAYSFPADLVMDALFAFVAIAEPSLNWVVDLLKGVQKCEDEDEIAAARTAASEREKVQEFRPRAGTVAQGNNSGKPHAVAPVVAAGAAAALAFAPITSAHAVAHSVSPTPKPYVAREDTESAAHDAHGWRGPRDVDRWRRFIEAYELGASGAEIVRQTGIPRTTAYRWRQLMLNAEALSDSL